MARVSNEAIQRLAVELGIPVGRNGGYYVINGRNYLGSMKAYKYLHKTLSRRKERVNT